MIGPQAIEFYNHRFLQEVRDNLRLYWQTRKFKISGPVKSYLQGADGPVVLQELGNWENITALPDLVIDPNVESLVVSLAREVAFSVDLLLRIEAGKHGNAKDVRNLYTTDLFERSDGTPNLVLNVVLNAPLSVADPAGLIPGWVSYRFHFACGFPAKAESEYTFSSQTEQAVA